MKKKLFFAAVAIVALASCVDNEYVGEVSPNLNTGGDNQTIVFGSGTKALTRADKTGADAAGLLGNNFVVEGVKVAGTTKTTVFDHYNVNWKANTANTTTSNTNDWEYVAQTKHDLTSVAAQSIKYWDYATTQYDFIAFSKGTATAVYNANDYDASANVLFTAITPSTLNTSAYTVKGKASELAKVYIADMVTAYRDGSTTGDAAGDYGKVVQFKFRSLSAKVRIALYETVPGYSVKDVVFYTADNTKATDGNAYLYTTSPDAFNEQGTYTVYYPNTGSTKKDDTDYNKAHLSFAAETGTGITGTATSKDFGALDKTNTAADKEVAETSGKVYLGRSSNEATYAGDNATKHYTTVIPNETGAVLNLKVDYTLISTDGSGETINVTGATAKVPAIYASWKSGYAYTYIFKISHNSNGMTNPNLGPVGLYPITFDAVVTETEDGVQETITTVAIPSITTYAKGQIVTTNNEYTTGSNIYVMTSEGTLTTTNTNLYTVTLEEGAAQTINEATVANALAKATESSGTWTVTDANNKAMVITSASGLSIVTEIAAADAPDGNAIAANAAKFTPSAAGTYVFEYVKTARTAGTPAVYTAVADGTTLTVNNTYYTDASGGGEFKAEGNETANGTNYFEKTSDAVAANSGEYYYKIIKVVAASGN